MLIYSQCPMLNLNFAQEEDLDSQQGVIDFSLYLRTGGNNSMNATTDTVDSSSMTAVLDQKNYVEELNRHLS